MKIALISNCFESLGIEYLSTALKKAGHETRLFFDPRLFDDQMIVNDALARFFSETDRIVKELCDWSPDLVCLSVLSDFYLWAENLAKIIKQNRDVPVVMGGIHCTSVPDVVIRSPYVDYVVVGEGDEAIADLANSLAAGSDVGEIPNVWSKDKGNVRSNPPRPLIRDLDALGMPDKSLYDRTYLKRQKMYAIMTARGCPYRCTYCNSSLLRNIYADEKKFIRIRSVDHVIDELKTAVAERNPSCVNFYDEVFGVEIKWLREFAPRYRSEIGLPFLAVTHPGHCSEEYVGLLKEAGCAKLDIGVQSTDADIRKNVLHRNETTEQVGDAIDRVMKAGIFLMVENIFNLPGQNYENTVEMARFYNKHRPNGIKVFGLRIYPRTPIEQIALEKGLITQEFVERNASGVISKNELPFMGGSMSDRELFRFQTLFAAMPFLSQEQVDYILDRNLIERIPYFRNATLLSRLLTSKDFKHDAMSKIMRDRYKHHMVKVLSKIVSR